MKNLQIPKKSIIFAASFVTVLVILFGCVATKVGVKCDSNGCEFHADSIQFDKLYQFGK